ncbi:MAG: sterol desaturase family protein, partial [Halioglobus sp.]
MQEFWSQYIELATGTFAVLAVAYLSLLLSWPIFLLVEKFKPVTQYASRSQYALNWKITCSNLLLAPPFAAMIVLFAVSLVNYSGLTQLRIPTSELSVGIPFLDVILQGIVIFFTAVFLGDFWYYWWHRAQHQVPFLWELHKLHHSDEHMNSTTIYRSHFLEPAGQALVKGLTIGLIFDVTEAPETVLAIVAAGLLPVLWDYFIHANVRIDRLN